MGSRLSRTSPPGSGRVRAAAPQHRWRDRPHGAGYRAREQESPRRSRRAGRAWTTSRGGRTPPRPSACAPGGGAPALPPTAGPHVVDDHGLVGDNVVGLHGPAGRPCPAGGLQEAPASGQAGGPGRRRLQTPCRAPPTPRAQPTPAPRGLLGGGPPAANHRSHSGGLMRAPRACGGRGGGASGCGPANCGLPEVLRGRSQGRLRRVGDDVMARLLKGTWTEPRGPLRVTCPERRRSRAAAPATTLLRERVVPEEAGAGYFTQNISLLSPEEDPFFV